MSAPHPALLRVVAGRDVPVVDDEAALLRSVSEHRMTGAVLGAHQRGALALSATTVTTLGMWELAERRDHLLFWRTIRDVQAGLASAGVGVAVLKGVATETRWYDEMGQRACTDVDLLLDPAALDDVAEVVELIDPDRGSSAAIEWLARRRLLQHVDLHVGRIQVDLHFDPLKVGLPTRQLDEVWASTESLATPHGTIRVLRHEVELVLLLLHLNKDRFAYLGPFLDIRQILERANLDWAYLRGFVAREGLGAPVWKSLAAVTQVLGLAPHVDVPRVPGPRGWTWDRLWGRHAQLYGDEGRQRAPAVQRFLALHASGRTREKVRELRRQILPPRRLLEVAGRLDPDRSYLRYLTVDHFHSKPALGR